MARDTTTVRMDSDAANLKRALNAIIKQQDKLVEKLSKVAAGGKKAGESLDQAGRKGKKAGDEATKGFDSKKLLSFAGGMVGIGTAAGVVLGVFKLITAELDQIIRRQRDAAGFQITLSQARQNLLRNLVGESRETKAATLSRATALSTELGVPERFIAQAVSTAISSSGGNREAAFAAVRRSARLNREQPEEIGRFAGALLSIGRTTGSDDAAVNAGLLGKVAQLSNISNPQLQARNIAPSLINQVSQGSTPRGAGALFATLTTAGGDVEGAISGTGAISLAEQLRERLPSITEAKTRIGDLLREGFGAGQTPSKADQAELARLRTIVAGPDLNTTEQRIRALQADPTAARQFLSGASFEKKVSGPIRDLILNPKSAVARQFRENLAAIPDDARLAEFSNQQIADRSLDKLEIVGRTRQRLKRFAGRVKGEDVSGGLAGVLQEELPEIFRAQGIGAVQEKILLATLKVKAAEFQKDPFGTAIAVVRRRATQLDAPAVSGGFGESFVTTKPATEANIARAEDLRELADLLRDLKAEMVKLNGTANQQLRKSPGGTTMVPPNRDL